MCTTTGERIALTVAAAVVLSAVAAGLYAQDQGRGAGAAIEISSFDELCLIGTGDDYPLDGDYRLTADIDASGSRGLNGGAGFSPIGRRVVKYMDGSEEVLDTAAAFRGAFDGGGHTVSGLYINLAGSGANVGLFGFALGARISGVAVAADTVAGYRYVGALVGRQSGGVTEGCAASGAVAGRADAGGLVGAVDGGGVVRASYSSAEVGGEDVGDVGGLAGSADYAEIIGCYAVGGVAVSGGVNVGGLAGSLANAAKVRSCYAMASVSGGGASGVGGLVGRNDGGVRQSYSAGAVSGGGDVGGLIGVQGVGVGTTTYSFWDTERSGRAASAGGSGVAGRTTAQMMDAAAMRNLVSADTASWGISNNYPYLKNKSFPLYTVTVAAGWGGALSGATTAGGTVHTQKANHWTAGCPVAAMASPDSIVSGFDGWYVAGSDTALAGGQYDGFAAEISEDGKTLSLPSLTADSVAIEARFILKKYTLKYVAVNGRGTIAPRDSLGEYSADTLIKTVEHGAASPVAALPNAGYKFLEWMDAADGARSKSPARSDTALSDGLFRAFFAVDTMVIAYAADSLYGKLRINGSYRGVQSHTAKVPYGGDGPKVEAVPNEPADKQTAVRFAGWSDGRTDNPRVDSAVTGGFEVTAIFEETPVAVKSPDRIIPGGRSIDETALILPMRAAGGFTAGPNPVSRQSGRAEFYRQGAGTAEGTLLVFDAAGNFVNKIVVGGVNGINSINNNSTNNRPIAVWDLTDATGKPVGAGAYLVKGALSMKNGTHEKVMLVLMLR